MYRPKYEIYYFPVYSNLNINLIVNVRWIAKTNFTDMEISPRSRYFTVNILPSEFHFQHFFEKRISNGVKSYEKGVCVENLNCCSSIMRGKRISAPEVVIFIFGLSILLKDLCTQFH